MSSRGGVAARRRLVRFGLGSTWSAHQLALAAVATLGGLLYLVALDRASGGFESIYWLLAAVPTLLLAVNGSAAPLAYWGLMLFGWFVLTPAGSFSPWAVLGAVGVLLGHAAAALSASAPPPARFPATTLRRWAGGLLAAAATAAAVGLVAGLLRGRVDGWAVVAQGLALLGLTAGVWLLRSEPPAEAS